MIRKIADDTAEDKQPPVHVTRYLALSISAADPTAVTLQQRPPTTQANGLTMNLLIVTATAALCPRFALNNSISLLSYDDGARALGDQLYDHLNRFCCLSVRRNYISAASIEVEEQKTKSSSVADSR